MKSFLHSHPWFLAALIGAGLAVLVSCSTPASRVDAQGGTPRRPLRIGIRGSLARSNHISSLTYNATFQAQTLIYETLVKRDPEGRIAPGLASSWEFADAGRTVIFTLRDGATWHDGTPVTADDVRIHFKRWLGLPEYAWIHSSERVREIVAESTNRLRITMNEPHALLPDLCAIRPGAIGGPGCLDREGEWVKPIGSGPFKFVELRENSRVCRLQRVRPAGESVRPADFIDLVPFDADCGEETEPFEMFRRGQLDVLVDGWKNRIPREQVENLRRQPGVQVEDGPGSVLQYVSFSLAGPTAAADLRRHIAAAFDRAELIQLIEGGYADPTFAWAAPTVKTWPQIRPPALSSPVPRLDRPLRLLGSQNRFRPRERQLCEALVAQLQRAGFPAACELKADEAYKRSLEAGDYDLRTEITWGVPYDPDMSLKSRFLPTPFKRPSGASNRFFGVDPRAEALARQIAAAPDEKDRVPLYARMQRLLTAEALAVPLYVPRRVAVMRGVRAELRLDHDVYRNPLTIFADLP